MFLLGECGIFVWTRFLLGCHNIELCFAMGSAVTSRSWMSQQRHQSGVKLGCFSAHGCGRGLEEPRTIFMEWSLSVLYPNVFVAHMKISCSVKQWVQHISWVSHCLVALADLSKIKIVCSSNKNKKEIAQLDTAMLQVDLVCHCPHFFLMYILHVRG